MAGGPIIRQGGRGNAIYTSFDIYTSFEWSA